MVRSCKQYSGGFKWVQKFRLHHKTAEMGIVKEKTGKIKKKASDVFQDKLAAYLSTGKNKQTQYFKIVFLTQRARPCVKKSKLTGKLLLTKLSSVAVALFIRCYSVIRRLA